MPRYIASLKEFMTENMEIVSRKKEDVDDCSHDIKLCGEAIGKVNIENGVPTYAYWQSDFLSEAVLEAVKRVTGKQPFTLEVVGDYHAG